MTNIYRVTVRETHDFTPSDPECTEWTYRAAYVGKNLTQALIAYYTENLQDVFGEPGEHYRETHFEVYPTEVPIEAKRKEEWYP